MSGEIPLYVESLISRLFRRGRQRRPLPAAAVPPATFELRFARLQRKRSFEQIWELLAVDAQQSWGSRDVFVAEMREQADGYELIEASVRDVAMLPEWTDRRGRRTYRNVARLAVRYRIRHGDQELAMERQVHLVPAPGGWRTLYYPAAG